MSLRYKFIISLLTLTGVCLAIYIWIAKSVFEHDKEVSVLQAATQTSNAIAVSLKHHLETDIDAAKKTASVLLKTRTPKAADPFLHNSRLLAIGVLENDHWLFFRSQSPTLTPEDLYARSRAQPQQSALLLNQGGLVAVTSALNSAPSSAQTLFAVFRLEEELEPPAFSFEDGGSFLALSSIAVSMAPHFPTRLANELLKGSHPDYLIAIQPVGIGNLRVATAVPKELAFHGLTILYLKSVQFFCLIFCLVLVISVVMTRKLLQNLDRITIAANQIAKGDFDFRLAVTSNDEFGRVAASFHHMSKEIKRLLTETKEKTRMETELKTAQTVQENLFPTPGFKNDFVEINGLYRSASECGGDWWYHFEHATGLYVFICDATGHGAPAALITAAAKAAVNVMRRDNDLTLLKLVEAFNYALYETAKGNILMTGFVLQIKPDQSVSYINGSHEPPLLFDNGAMEFVIDPIGPRFGQALHSVFRCGHLPPLTGKFLLMYTDGITTQPNAEGREVGDRRFVEFLRNPQLKSGIATRPSQNTEAVRAGHAMQNVPLAELNASIFQWVDDFREKVPQADDLTIVSIRFPPVPGSQKAAGSSIKSRPAS